MKVIRMVAMGAIFLIALGSSAHSASFFNTLVSNAINTYEDQDREVICDLDKDNQISEGDVLLAWVRYDNRSQPLPGDTLPNGDLYSIVTQEVQAFSRSDIIDPGTPANPFDDFIVYDIDLQPTQSAKATALGLDLGSLVTLPGGLEAGTAAAALYEDVGIDLVANSPGDVNGDNQFDMFDFVERIEQGNLDLVGGFGGSVANPDETDDHIKAGFFIQLATTGTAADDPLQNLNLLGNLTLLGGIPGSNDFHAGMSILFDSSPVWEFGDDVPDAADNPAIPTFHELTVTNGGISGAADLVYNDAPFGPENPFFFTIADTFSGGADINVWGVSTNSDLNVTPSAIPEPGTMLLLGSGLLGAGALGRRRKKKDG